MKIGFVLSSPVDEPIPSTRIAVLNVMPLLREHGWQCEILYAPTAPEERPTLPDDLLQQARQAELQMVVFQKVHGASVRLAVSKMREAGIATTYLVCDRVDPDMVGLTDGTGVVTEYLRSLHPLELQPRIHVVHDGIERPEIVRNSSPSSHRGSRTRPLHAVLVTSSDLDHLPVILDPPPWLQITIVGRYPDAVDRMAWAKHVRWRAAQLSTKKELFRYLRFLSNPRVRLLGWNADLVYKTLVSADLGILPIERTIEPPRPDHPVPAWKLKSENRLTLKMSVGLPVVATPIPAYEAVVGQGVNGYLASDRTEWLDALEALRDPQHRFKVGQRARASVLVRFGREAQAARLMAALESIARTSLPNRSLS